MPYALCSAPHQVFCSTKCRVTAFRKREPGEPFRPSALSANGSSRARSEAVKPKRKLTTNHDTPTRAKENVFKNTSAKGESGRIFRAGAKSLTEHMSFLHRE